jgi:hypothetical protein
MNEWTRGHAGCGGVEQAVEQSISEKEEGSGASSSAAARFERWRLQREGESRVVI